VVYLVRSLGLMPEFVSHDWHVQPSCQRPNRGPPRRRVSVQANSLFVSEPTRANSTVLETLQTYSAAENPVNPRIPQDFQMISTSGKSFRYGIRRALRSKTRATVWSSGRSETPLSAHADTEDKNIEKRSYLLWRSLL
jgi:hypothetical protein